MKPVDQRHAFPKSTDDFPPVARREDPAGGGDRDHEDIGAESRRLCDVGDDRDVGVDAGDRTQTVADSLGRDHAGDDRLRVAQEPEPHLPVARPQVPVHEQREAAGSWDHCGRSFHDTPRPARPLGRTVPSA